MQLLASAEIEKEREHHRRTSPAPNGLEGAGILDMDAYGSSFH